MIEVDTPDGGVAEFPDGTSPDVITNALRKRFPAPGASEATSKGVGDYAQEFGAGVLHSARRAASGLAGAGKFMLGPLAKPFEAANEYATSKGYPLAPTDRMLAESQQAVDAAGPAATVGQIGGDIAMMAAPGGAVSKAASALPKALGIARNFHTATRLGANVVGQGALNAAVAPEDRGTAFVLGAGGQAVGDTLLRGAPAVFRLGGGKGRDALAQRRAGDALLRSLANGADQTDATDIVAGRVGDRLREGPTRGATTRDIPLTAPQAARQMESETARPASAALAALHLGAAPSAPQDITTFLRGQNAATFDAAVNRAGAEGTDAAVDAAKAARDTATAPLRERALTFADQAAGASLANPVRAALNDVAKNQAAGGATDRLVQFVGRTLDANPNAATLYSLRKTLTDMLHGPVSMDSEGLTAAVKGNETQVLRVINSIDGAINDASSTSDLVNQIPMPAGARFVSAPGDMTHLFGEGMTRTPGMRLVPSDVNQRDLFGAAGDTTFSPGGMRIDRASDMTTGQGRASMPNTRPGQMPDIPREGQVDMFPHDVQQITFDTPARVMNQRAGQLPEFPQQVGQGDMFGAETSPGRWAPYLERFAQESGPVTSARAQRGINEALQAPGGRLIGDTPEVTRNVLKQAMKANRTSKQFGTSNLDPAAEARYDELTKFLQRNEESVNALKSAAGGGSDTVLKASLGDEVGRAAAAQTAAHFLPGAGLIYSLSRSASSALTASVRKEVATMLLDPAKTAAAIDAALKRGQPLTDAQMFFRQLPSTAATQGLQEALQTPQEIQ